MFLLLLETQFSKCQLAVLLQIMLRQARLANSHRQQQSRSSYPNKSDELCILSSH